MPDEPQRRELHDEPPFLSWTALYLIVAGALLADVALFAVITLIYR